MPEVTLNEKVNQLELEYLNMRQAEPEADGIYPDLYSYIFDKLTAREVETYCQENKDKITRHFVSILTTVGFADYYFFAALSTDKRAKVFPHLLTDNELLRTSLIDKLFTRAAYPEQNAKIFNALEGQWHHIIKSLPEFLTVLNRLSPEQAERMCVELREVLPQLYQSCLPSGSNKSLLDLFIEEVVGMVPDEIFAVLCRNMANCWPYIVESMDDFLAVFGVLELTGDQDLIPLMYEAIKAKLAAMDIPADTVEFISDKHLPYLTEAQRAQLASPGPRSASVLAPKPQVSSAQADEASISWSFVFKVLASLSGIVLIAGLIAFSPVAIIVGGVGVGIGLLGLFATTANPEGSSNTPPQIKPMV